MAKNLPTFAKLMRVRARYVTKNSDRLVGAVAIGVATELVERTPVDTGRARTNWRTTFYKPSDVLFPRPEKPPDPEWAAGRAIDEAEVTAGQYTGRRSIYIVNNVDYLEYLEKGTAKMPPLNFLEHAFYTANRIVRNREPLLSKPVEATIMMAQDD